MLTPRHIKTTILTAAGLLTSVLLPTMVYAASLENQVLECARKIDSQERHVCYDQLGQRVVNSQLAKQKAPELPVDSSQTQEIKSGIAPDSKGAEEAVTAPTVVASTNEVNKESEVLPEAYGGSKFSKDKKDTEPESYIAKVVSCKRGGDNKYLFVFENGQIWKQVKAEKRRYKNCNYPVTVTKDIFGYKMTIDGKRKAIRINRRR